MNCPECQKQLKRLHGKLLSCENAADRHLFCERVVIILPSRKEKCILECIDKKTGWPLGIAYEVDSKDLP